MVRVVIDAGVCIGIDVCVDVCMDVCMDACVDVCMDVVLGIEGIEGGGPLIICMRGAEGMGSGSEGADDYT